MSPKCLNAKLYKRNKFMHKITNFTDNNTEYNEPLKTEAWLEVVHCGR